MTYRWLGRLVAMWCVGVALIAALAFLSSCGMMPAHAQARLDNLVSGSASATGTGATQIIAAPTTTRRIYVTSVQCGRNDAGTSAIFATLNDNASTVVVVPNSGGGGGSNMTFPSPLTVPAATALTFQASSGVTTLYCNAQGYTGN
jgi:hypothetical protein